MNLHPQQREEVWSGTKITWCYCKDGKDDSAIHRTIPGWQSVVQKLFYGYITYTIRTHTPRFTCVQEFLALLIHAKQHIILQQKIWETMENSLCP